MSTDLRSGLPEYLRIWSEQNPVAAEFGRQLMNWCNEQIKLRVAARERAARVEEVENFYYRNWNADWRVVVAHPDNYGDDLVYFAKRIAALTQEEGKG